jgi:hypothetical protein
MNKPKIKSTINHAAVITNRPLITDIKIFFALVIFPGSPSAVTNINPPQKIEITASK